MGSVEQGWHAACWEVGRESYCRSTYKVRTDRQTLLQEGLLLSVGKHLLLLVRVVSPLYCGLVTVASKRSVGVWGCNSVSECLPGVCTAQCSVPGLHTCNSSI